MILTIPPDEKSAGDVRWFPIQVPGGSFEIGIRPPTFDEQIADAERFAGVQLARLERHITGWRGLEQRAVDTSNPDQHVETSQPLPYSLANFRRLCSGYRGVLPQVLTAVNRTFRGLDEAGVKNSDGTPPTSPGSVPATTES